MTEWPTDLYHDFAFFPERGAKLEELAHLAESEDWGYQHTNDEYDCPILFSYLRYTYRRVADENKIALTDDGRHCCFNTGLVTSVQEEIYAYFEINRREGVQVWFFRDWLRQGTGELNRFSKLPDIAHYFDDPSALVFDDRMEFRVDVEHIIHENRDRFPEPYKSMSEYQLRNILAGVIESAKRRVRRNYKTAIPQYYRGRIQLLLPLCLDRPEHADLAIVVERHDNMFYRAATCLTIDMAYNNARLITKPDRDWLQP